MVMAWSRISSKVIAHPPEADEACSRRCGNRKSRSDVCIPHMIDKRKQAILGARDAEVTPFSQTPGDMCHGRLGRQQSPQTHLEPGVHHVPRPTTYQETRESQEVSSPQSTGAP